MVKYTITESVSDFIEMWKDFNKAQEKVTVKGKNDIMQILPDDAFDAIRAIINDNECISELAEILRGLGVSEFLIGYFIGRITEKELVK